jgi:MFS transporter, SHS family, lactate transporter
MLQFRNHGSRFEKHKTAFEEGGGRDDAILDEGRESGQGEIGSSGRDSEDVIDEKASVRQKETA